VRRSAAAAAADGRRRPARPQVRTGLLHLPLTNGHPNDDVCRRGHGALFVGRVDVEFDEAVVLLLSDGCDDGATTHRAARERGTDDPRAAADHAGDLRREGAGHPHTGSRVGPLEPFGLAELERFGQARRSGWRNGVG